MPVKPSYAKVARALKKGKRFIVTTHLNPDGDGVGAMLALARALKKLGKNVVMYAQDPVPAALKFLPDADRIVHVIPPKARFDAAVMVDCGEPVRASKEFAALVATGLPVIVIDHHLFANLPGALMCIDARAASAGEVVWRVLGALGAPRDAATALCIYTTLVVDTGFFRYSNTTDSVFALAARLVETGAEPWLVAKHLDESYPHSRMKLLGASLASLALMYDGRYGSMEVTRAMLEATGATLADSDEFAGYPRSIKSVEVAALFREVDAGTVKVSLRSKDYVNVAAIARRHDGGGHKHAAGFTLHTDIEAAKNLVRDEVEKELAGK